MRIHFSRRADISLDLLCELGREKTGFIFGIDLGNNKIIESIIPLDFKESNVKHLYDTVYKKKGDSLMGVFFIKRDYFLSECFFENIVLSIQDNQRKVFRYGFDDSCGNTESTLIYSHKA